MLFRRLNKGFVLVAVMILMLVLSAVSLFVMRMNVENLHAIQSSEQGDREQREFRAMEDELERRVANNDIACVMPTTSAIRLRQLTSAWWLANGCHIMAGGHGLYITEDMVRASGESKQYYRVAIVLVTDKMNISDHIYQAILLKQVPSRAVSRLAERLLSRMAA